jgi:hypothetical protein
MSVAVVSPPGGARGAAISATVVLTVLAGVWALPRAFDLAALPGRLDRGLAAAARYNAGLEEVARIEATTTETLGGLDRIAGSLRRVHTLVAGLDPALAAVVARLEDGVAAGLRPTVAETARVAASLDRLEAELRSLPPAFRRSVAALAEARGAVDEIVAATKETASQVGRVRVSLDATARNVAGPEHTSARR